MIIPNTQRSTRGVKHFGLEANPHQVHPSQHRSPHQRKRLAKRQPARRTKTQTGSQLLQKQLSSNPQAILSNHPSHPQISSSTPLADPGPSSTIGSTTLQTSLHHLSKSAQQAPSCFVAAPHSRHQHSQHPHLTLLPQTSTTPTPRCLHTTTMTHDTPTLTKTPVKSSTVPP